MELVLSENVRQELELGVRLSGFQAHEPWRSGCEYESIAGGPVGVGRVLDESGAESILWSDSRVVISRPSNQSAETRSPGDSRLPHRRTLPAYDRPLDLQLRKKPHRPAHRQPPQD